MSGKPGASIEDKSTDDAFIDPAEMYRKPRGLA